MFKRFALLLTVASALMLGTQVYGSCFNSPAQIMQIGSKGMVTCEYQGINFLEGATFNTTDCFSCSCSSWGLSCCGFGIKAGLIGVPSGFRVVQYGCDFQIENEGGEDHLPRDTE
ncbi:hypothetical protein CHS0354_013591 [Potamilus streckersoni]|uniref:Uncharacterized protein n=1 Tax=Potamilus streckersoni TaxID=2493646 RepID=A0AAE0SLE6_9BIVA|nr:hypothetical protein CHS0354_013591 [Potamilus streckersoni]